MIVSRKGIWTAALAFLAVSTSWAAPAPLPDPRPKTVAELKADVLQAVNFRLEAYAAYSSLHAKTSRRLPLTGSELHFIHQGVMDSIVPGTQLVAYWYANLPLFDRGWNAYTEMEKTRFLRALGTGVVMADAYLQSIRLYDGDSSLRRIVNEKNSVPGKPGDLMKTTLESMLNPTHSRPLGRAWADYARNRAEIEARAAADEEAAFWVGVVEKSVVAGLLDEEGIGLDSARVNDAAILRFFEDSLSRRTGLADTLHRLWSRFVTAISKGFGNFVGTIQWRKGRLYQSAAVAADLRGKLRPLDVLLEKTPFRATDLFIPGYWGHNAIWLGTEAELRALGLWDHPVFVPLQGRIRQGQSIVEALRPGVTTNAIEHFLDIDDLAVIRARSLTPEQVRESLIVAASQYGKIYNFAFNVETQDALVCSELILMSFGDYEWRTEKKLGRWTINPDAVAEKSVPGAEFDVISLYVGGTRQDAKLGEKMRHILRYPRRKDSRLLEDFRKL